MEELIFKASDRTNVYRMCCKPSSKNSVKAVCHIAHGMAEHSQRYRRLAAELVKHGFVVYVNDHRGHGKTATDFQNNPLGVALSERQRRLNSLTPRVDPAFTRYLSNGFERIILDLKEMVDEEKELHKNLPFILLGHSMGSVIAQTFAGRYGNKINGLILSGPPARPNALLTTTTPALLGSIQAFVGIDSTSSVVHALTMGSYARNVVYSKTELEKHTLGEVEKTDNDWLSRDSDEVKKFNSDPFCGFQCSVGFWGDFLPTLFALQDSNKALKNFPKDRPCFVMSGGSDPCGEFGYALKQVVDEFKYAGLPKPKVRTYDGARHEIFNEINRDEVTADFLEFCDDIARRHSKL